MRVEEILFSVFISSVTAIYNCNRPNVACSNSATCDTSSSECVCQSTAFSGKDCAITNSHTDCTSNPCLNGATCKLPDGSTPECYCTEDYAGMNCDVARYEISCDGTSSMTVTIYPDTTSFTGFIFPYQRGTEMSCFFTDTGAGTTYTKTFPHTDATCGDAVFDSDDSSYSRTFYMVFDVNNINSGETITATCRAPSPTISAATVSSTDYEGILIQEQISLVVVDTDVDMTVTSNNGAISSPLTIGDPVEAALELSTSGTTKFNAIRAENCRANNGFVDTNPNYISVDFITGSCPSSSLPIFTDAGQGLTKVSDTKVTLTFAAFIISGSTTVEILCDVKACSSVSQCAPVACTGDTAENTGYGKRKREVEPLKTVSFKYTVSLLSREERAKIAQDGGANTNCPTVILFLSILLTLGQLHSATSSLSSKH